MNDKNSALNQILDLTENGQTIKLDYFMQIALNYYYANSKIFGSEGDFITAPEISQMFGETIGIWCALNFERLDFKEFSIVEIGPGRGLLMKDLLRATKQLKDFNQALRKIYLIENSFALAHIQQANIIDHRAVWLKHIGELEAGNLIIIANEFFDALPIKQFKKNTKCWSEIVVAQQHSKLVFQEIPISELNSSADIPNGAIIEVANYAHEYAELIASKITQGAFLTIDYGYLKSNYISTLQAVHRHKYVPVLENIGEVDLTSHVDFTTLKNIFNEKGFNTEIALQADFLSSYGIMLRAEKLIKEGANPAHIAAQIRRLMASDQMGALFKVLQAIKH